MGILKVPVKRIVIPHFHTYPRVRMEMEYGFTQGACKENCHTHCLAFGEVWFYSGR